MEPTIRKAIATKDNTIIIRALPNLHYAALSPFTLVLTLPSTSTPHLPTASILLSLRLGISDTMSLFHESRTFPDYPQSTMMHDSHQEQDDNSMQHHRYPSPPPPMSDNAYISQDMDATEALNLDMPELPLKEDSDAPSPERLKAIPKPDREVTKGEDGRFICTWIGCNEEVRTFNRKCEWSKHMDKHDRPYKCPSEGCEKLPGFTYSGGLLRHQREVHMLHGGPRKQLNCPHPNCKRFSGKGFSRQENLNEHLRRVHTDAAEVLNAAEETDEEGSEVAGMKRKRPQYDGVDVRMEMKRLRKENEELKKQADIQTSRTNELVRQLQTLQNLVGTRIQQVAAVVSQQQQQQAPQASML
ncbi:hypothetical protein VTL71DRAFT_10779 [Oculimacula yallundae]|uniref:C2H2-type domain-containing protein n=1 Tax=Oculimacula yallundae TaxID=86028 RepID=A0ABR4CU95_9HELO